MDADAINHHIANIYHEAVAAGHDDIQAIGISAAGNVGADRRTLTFAANIPAWINYDLSEHIGALIDHAVPVVVENDANCAGWGEYVHGAGQGSSNMVALTVGTGLGGAIVINGQLYRGSFGMAAELGHLPMVPDGDHCGCGLRGCAERYTSGTSLENFAKSAVRRRPQDAKRLMELCGGDISKLEGPMVSQAAQEGDVLGLYAFGKIGEWLGRTMAAVSAVLDPDLFVIGGGVVASATFCWSRPATTTSVSWKAAPTAAMPRSSPPPPAKTPASSVPPTWLCADDAAPATGRSLMVSHGRCHGSLPR